jgi:hypothetical protein
MSGRGILDADMQTVWRWITAGVRWWLDELRTLVPARLQTWQTARNIIADYKPDTGEVLTRLDPAAPYPRRLGPVTIILPKDFCLSRMIEQPVMSLRNLNSMIRLEGPRLMPMAAADLIIAARIVSRSEVGGARMQVEVAAMPRRAAEALGEVLARQDQQCLGILTSTPEPDQAPPINFLPVLQEAGLTSSRSRSALPLWIAAGFLFLLNLGLLVWRDSAAVHMLETAVAEQQPAVNAVRRINSQIARADRFAAATVAARITSEPLEMLSRVAATLPEGVWVQRYTWQGDSLRIAGYRPAQADIAGGLRRAGLSVQRYSDSTSATQGQLGKPFEVTLRVNKP